MAVISHHEGADTFARVETYVVRVWMPDRPGALGQVASRIGAVRGDVVGIDILERGGGKVIDELVVALPDGSVVDLLVAEISQVDGVAVEDVQRVPPERPDPGLAALDLAARLVETSPSERLAAFCSGLATLFEADWVMAVDLITGETAQLLGVGPDSAWLTAFVEGSRHLADGAAEQSPPGDFTPGDLAWGIVDSAEQVIALGRSARPLHMRERRQLSRLCRIHSALLIAPLTPVD
ncbi:MAG: hypothetical protein RLZZ623_3427 [Actinomycetota bacterium]|jgi:hypothetical protein